MDRRGRASLSQGGICRESVLAPFDARPCVHASIHVHPIHSFPHVPLSLSFHRWSTRSVLFSGEITTGRLSMSDIRKSDRFG